MRALIGTLVAACCLSACFEDNIDEGESNPTSSSTAGTNTDGQSTSLGGTTSTDPDSGTDAETTRGATEGLDSSTGAETTTGGPPSTAFFDDFERPDADDLGNDWIEATPSAHTLSGGEIAGVAAAGGPDWPAQVWYRPPEEDQADIELGMEFTITIEDPANHPALFARMDPTQLPTGMQAYVLWVRQSDPAGPRLRLDRFDGDASMFIQQGIAVIDAPLALDTRYRLRLQIAGNNPVELLGALDVDDGTDWETLYEISAADASLERLTDPGSWGGSSGYTPQLPNVRFDNFSAGF